MALDPKDLELIERLIYKNADDSAVAITRSFERIEDRMDANESRVLLRMSAIEEKLGEVAGDIESYRHDIAEKVDELALRV